MMNGSVNTSYLWSMLAVAGIVTFLLRAFPFLVFGSGKRQPESIRYLGRMISPAAIAMLVVYCFGCYAERRPLPENGWGIAELSAAVIVVLLQRWKRNPLLSILCGTAVYMFLVQNVIC